MPTLIKTFTSAQASGVKSYISTAAASSFSTSTWTNVGTGASGATTTTAAELPELTVGSAIKVTNAGSGTGYMESAEFRIDADDLGKLLAINYNFLTSASPAYAASDFQVQVWDSTTSNGSYAQNTTVSTPNVPANSSGGSFTISFSQQNARPFTKLRIVRSAGATNSWAAFSTIQMTPGTITQGAAVGYIGRDTSLTTANFVNSGNVTGVVVDYWRIGNILKARGRFTGGIPVAATASITLRDGHTADLGTATQIVGRWWRNTATGSARKASPLIIGTGETTLKLTNDDYTTAVDQGSPINGSSAIGSGGEVVFFEYEVPVSAWAGNGTVNLGAGAQVEYAYNTSTNTTTSDTTSFGYGPSGALIGNITANLQRTVRFQYPIQNSDLLFLEYWAGGNDPWQPVASCNGDSRTFLLQTQNTTTYGMAIQNTAVAQTVRVNFGQYSLPSGATYASAGTAWSTLGGSFYWRVRKVSPSSPVGFGLAASGTSGLINYYQEDDTTLASCTFQGNLGGSASAAIAIKITRVGRVVTLDIPQLATIVPTGSSAALLSNTNLPTWARPSVGKSVRTGVYNNGAASTTPGYLYVAPTGQLQFYRDALDTGWTNSTNCGWLYTQVITYTV
jgi:hypothetical protein